MAESAGEKTEKATDHKRREERKKGNVMQSKDVVTAAFVLIIFCVLKAFMKTMIAVCESSFDYWFGLAGGGMDGATIDGMPLYSKLAIEIGKVLLICAGPTLIVGVLVTVIATGAQTKFLFSKESIKFKFSKLNPVNGIKKMFSLSSAFELAKAILKLVVLAVVVYGEVKKRIPEFAQLFDMEIASSMMYMLDTIFTIVIKV
ncbi:MAG: EscU/YscU/HrcU family type III secretion system export apparatus switch protein, partial [Oscillospiraceae bacterium]